MDVDAEVLLNVDADRDGRLLGDLRDVADVFDVLEGDFSEFEEIVGDIQVVPTASPSRPFPRASWAWNWRWRQGGHRSC